METVENTRKLIDFVSKNYEGGNLDDDSLVQLIELKFANMTKIMF